MSDFVFDLQRMQTLEKKQQEQGFWTGHSLFQLPSRVLDYKGSAECLVLTYFFERANSISFYSQSAVVIEIHVQQKTVAERTGLDEDTVSRAVNSLEADQAIQVCRRRDPKTKQIKLSIYILLHSETKNPLMSTPGTFGVCHQNLERPFISAPKETRPQLMQMKPGGRAVYLAALALASSRVSTSFGMRRDEWKSESRLGRNAFDRGLKECLKRKLLTYKKYVLTLNDPVTGAPSNRGAHEFIRHENPQWKFDLNTVTADQWQQIVQELLKRDFLINSNGWTWTRREILCPFCRTERSFTVNFQTGQYRCHAAQCGDKAAGRLGQLVARVLRVPMNAAKEYIRSRVGDVGKQAA